MLIDWRNLFCLYSKQFDNWEIRKNKQLKVNMSIPNVRLFIGNIPKEMSKEDIHAEFHKIASKSQMVRVPLT